MSRHAFLAIAFAISTPAPALAAEFVVAPDGNDTNPGTVAAPFATPARAQQAVRERVAKGLSEAVTVTLRGGVHRLIEPLTFGVADGGTPEHSITWRAADGERVVLSGGKAITGWTAGEDGVWRAHLPEVERDGWQFRELFINGGRRTRARYPNADFLRVKTAGPDRRTSFFADPNAFSPLSARPDVEVVFLHDWSISRVLVKESDFATGRIDLLNAIGASMPQFAIDNYEPHPRFFLENDPVFLDAPGEWYLDRPTGQILYRPLPDEKIESIEAVVPLATALVVVRGDEMTGTPVRNLHFAGIDFEHCAWPLPGPGYAGIQATFHDVRTDAGAHMSPGPAPTAVSFTLAEGCTVTDAALRHLGGSGIEFGSRCRGCVLARSIIQDVSANGVILGESTARQVNAQPWWQAAPDQVATGNVVEDCLVERCGAQFYGGVGIWAGITAETAIRRNLVRDLPYTGVSLGWMWAATPSPARANRVEANHIHDVMRLLSDGGGIYTLGLQPDSAIVGNVVHTIPPGAGRAESNGMFVDEGSTGFTIQENTILGVANSPLRFHKAGGNLIRNNTLAVPEGVPPFRYGNTPEASIELRENKIVPAAEASSPESAATGAGPPPEVLARLLERAK